MGVTKQQGQKQVDCHMQLCAAVVLYPALISKHFPRKRVREYKQKRLFIQGFALVPASVQ